MTIDEILLEALTEVCDEQETDTGPYVAGYAKEIIESIKDRLAENDLGIVELDRL